MLPGNILLRYISPNKMIGESVVSFGAIVCGMSGAQNYQTLLALRILVGFAQAFIQGVSVYTSLWFKRDEIATVGGMSAKHNQRSCH
jgi:MFS family permease